MRLTGLLLVLVLLVSCQRNARPRSVLPEEKMKVVMWDMMRADQFLIDYVFSRDSSIDRYMESMKWYGQVLSLHDISQEQFKKSFTWYSEHPAQMKILMDSIAAIPDTNGVMIRPTPAKQD